MMIAAVASIGESPIVCWKHRRQDLSRLQVVILLMKTIKRFLNLLLQSN